MKTKGAKSCPKSAAPKYVLYFGLSGRSTHRTKKEVWESIGKLPFGCTYEVHYMDSDSVVDEFLPF